MESRILAFHPFHTLSFPWPALETRVAQSKSRKDPVWERARLVRTGSMSDSAITRQLKIRRGSRIQPP